MPQKSLISEDFTAKLSWQDNRTKEGMFDKTTDFSADKFTPTTWEPAKKKAQFAKQFIRFIEADFPRRQFTHAFHQRLALTFGHIAHVNRHLFYDAFFTSTEGKLHFLRQILQCPCYGDPAFTYSDVERALQSWLLQSDILARYEERLAQEAEAAERAELARLKAKYEMASTRSSTATVSQ